MLFEGEPHDYLPLIYFAGVNEAEACVERVRGVFARVVAELHLLDAVLPCFSYEQFECAAAIPFALLAGVNYEAPDPDSFGGSRNAMTNPTGSLSA